MPSKREIERLRLLGLGLGILAVPMLLGIQRGRRRSTGASRNPLAPKAEPDPAAPDVVTEGPGYPTPGPITPSDGLIKEVTDATIDAAIDGNSIVILDAYLTYCGPCMLALPALKKAASKHRGIHFIKLDGGEYNDTARQLGITGYPTFILFINGEQVESRTGGPSSAGEADAWVEDFLGDWLALE